MSFFIIFLSLIGYDHSDHLKSPYLDSVNISLIRLDSVRLDSISLDISCLKSAYKDSSSLPDSFTKSEYKNWSRLYNIYLKILHLDSVYKDSLRLNIDYLNSMRLDPVCKDSIRSEDSLEQVKRSAKFSRNSSVKPEFAWADTCKSMVVERKPHSGSGYEVTLEDYVFSDLVYNGWLLDVSPSKVTKYTKALINLYEYRRVTPEGSSSAKVNLLLGYYTYALGANFLYFDGTLGYSGSPERQGVYISHGVGFFEKCIKLDSYQGVYSDLSPSDRFLAYAMFIKSTYEFSLSVGNPQVLKYYFPKLNETYKSAYGSSSNSKLPAILKRCPK
ncbi:MAG: hypothetical protein WC614_04705 [bacterium]